MSPWDGYADRWRDVKAHQYDTLRMPGCVLGRCLRSEWEHERVPTCVVWTETWRSPELREAKA